MASKFILFLWFLTACNEESIMSGSRRNLTPQVKKIDKLALTSGDTLSIDGSNLERPIVVKIGESEVPYTSKSSISAEVSIPELTASGASQITFSSNGKVFASFPILVNVRIEDMDSGSLTADQVCDDIIFKDSAGALTRGLRSCGEVLKACSSAGEIDCRTVAAFPPVDTSDPLLIPAHIKKGITIAGISGIYPSAAAPLTGAVAGVADLTSLDTATSLGSYEFFDSAGGRYTGSIADGGTITPGTTDLAISAPNTVYRKLVVKGDLNLTPINIKDAVTLFAVTGALTGSPTICSSDGQTNCLTAANFPAIDKVNSLQANASQIRSGLTLAGVAGTLANCSVDGGAGCVAVGPTYAAALTTGAAAKILTGQSLAGVAGSGLGKPADCTSDGGIGCVTVANFPAVDKVTNLSAAKRLKIHSTVTVGGVAGTLADCAVDGGEDCFANFAFPAASVSGAAAKIVTGQTLAGISGSATAAPANCAADGATNCVAVALFPAIDKATKLSVGNAGKIHSSLTIAGVVGTLSDCAADGGTNCLAVSAFPAANATGAAAKVLTGQTLAGISGSAALRPSNCAADGATDCVAVALFPAVDKATKLSVGNAAKIHTTLSIAGVTGTMASCSVDGGTNCMAVAGYPAANTTGAAAKIALGDVLAGVTGTAGVRPSDCGSDGSTGCVATATYPAANSTGAAAKIASGDVLAGITGTAGVRPSDCSSDGATGCVAVTNFPAVDKLTKLSVGNAARIRSSLTIAGVVGTLDDCSTDGGVGCVTVGPTYAAAITTGVAAKVLTGQSVAGISGSATPAPANCAADGATNCVAVTNFPAVNKVTNLAAPNLAKISSSVTVGGVVGTMADCSADGTTGCLTVTAFPAANTSGAAAKILSGQTLAGVSGSATAAPSNCAADGATNCVAVALFPAVDKATKLSAGNAAKIRSSLTIAGVVGTLDDCTTDGGSGCVVTGPTYVSALTTGAAAKILSGQSIAGVSGSAAVKPADCASDGDINCVAVTNFPAVNKVTNLAAPNLAKISSSVTVGGVVGTLANCSADGTTACLTVTGFPSANTSGAAAKIITGQTLAGVSGSATPAPSNCAADGATNCVAVTNFPAVDKVTNLAVGNLAKISSTVTVGGVVGTLANCSADGTTACLTVSGFPSANTSGAAAKIITGQTLAGISGSATAAPANCSTDGQTNCVAITTFPALQKSLLTLDVLKNGTVINGVTGAYPNASYPLAGSTATADLTAATFNAQAKSSTAFEYFDSAGVRQTGSGDTDITGANIASGIDIFSTTGTFGANCTADGQTACITTSTFKSVDTSALTVWDIRKGKSAGGIAGSIAFYKNMANTSFFNRTTGTGSAAGLDVYDTIDDANSNGSFPTQNNTGWDQATGANWTAVVANTVYKDNITGLVWLKDYGSGYSWEDAITYCENSTNGSRTDWRLPTQKEQMQAYTDGIWSQKTAMSLDTLTYWSATTISGATGNVWVMNPGYGDNLNGGKGDNRRVLCVAP